MSLAERLTLALESGHARDVAVLNSDHHGGDVTPTVSARAAVLIAVTDRLDPGVLLTQRTETLRRHPGQIAFPGGRIDPDDASPTAAALREAEEEIGLSASAVTIVGVADHYRTITGFDVTPVVGVVPPDLLLTPNAAEVADVFEVPLGFVLDAANQQEATAMWQGLERRYYEIRWRERRIWGATAAMLVNLSRRLQWTG